MSLPDFRQAEHAGWLARAESYDAAFAAITSQAIVPVLDALARRVPGGLADVALLDVCCGPGHLAGAAACHGAEAQGIDFAASMVARAARNYPALRFREGDAQDLPFGDGMFGAVACLFGVMHLDQPDRAIAEAFRVLRPGGTFAFTQWAQDDDLLALVMRAVGSHGSPDVVLPPAPSPMRFSDPQECRRALNASGFTEVSVERLDLAWEGTQPADVLTLIHRGTVRASMLIEAQPPVARRRIETAIMEAARDLGDASGKLRLRRPSVLAFGRRPV
jgi:ubiquinone/menaquinone biosynthesis C-methylase UbiE